MRAITPRWERETIGAIALQRVRPVTVDSLVVRQVFRRAPAKGFVTIAEGGGAAIAEEEQRELLDHLPSAEIEEVDPRLRAGEESLARAFRSPHPLTPCRGNPPLPYKANLLFWQNG
jgi:hypothetical protein